MQTFFEQIITLVGEAKRLHASQLELNLRSVEVVGALDRRRASCAMGMDTESFAKHIGLSKDQYFKRVQVARVIHYHPIVKDMLAAGDTQISHIAAIAAKITQANRDVVLAGIKGKSKREVIGFISRVTPDGELLDQEDMVELRLTLTKSQLAVLDRAREVLAAGGKVPSTVEIMLKALDDLLKKRDPLQRAQRAAARAEHKNGAHTGSGPEDYKGAENDPGSVATAGNIAPAKDSGAYAPVAPAQAARVKAAAPGFAIAPVAPAQAAQVKASAMDGATAASAPAQAAQVKASAMDGAPAATMSAQAAKTKRPSIPAAVRHSVWLRDKGRCTYHFADGTRCPEQTMLELDHNHLFCRGGEHSEKNLALKCRLHNVYRAEVALDRLVTGLRRATTEQPSHRY